MTTTPPTAGTLTLEPGGVPGRAGQPGPPGATGPPGPRGGLFTATAGQNINATHVVAIDPDGLAYVASSEVLEDAERVVGVSVFAALAGELVTFASGGQVPANLAEPVGPLYLGPDGSLIQNHDAGAFQLRIAYAITANTLAVRIGMPIYL